jgi:ABC-type sugar transport system ATPase subunit
MAYARRGRQARSEIYATLHMAEQGLSILFYSTDLEEIRRLLTGS